MRFPGHHRYKSKESGKKEDNVFKELQVDKLDERQGDRETECKMKKNSSHKWHISITLK